MVRPERRSRADIIAAVAIAAVVAVVAGVLWWTSDARATVSQPASEPAKSMLPARVVPETLKELWTAASPHTTTPIVAGSSVVTGDGHTVAGRDPLTGDQRWSYARDSELCGVSSIYHSAVAVYPDSRGCGQVSAIDAATGKRGPARSGYADDRIELSTDGTTVLASGATRLELWRSDMVRVLGYGEVDARVKPSQTGLGKGCDIVSSASSSAAVSLLQACKDKPDLQLTLLRPGKEDDEPELHDVAEPGVTATSGARVLAVSETTTAVYLPLPKPRVAVIDETGNEVASTPLPEPPSTAIPEGTVSRAGDLITWWTGNSVVVFGTNQLGYRYTVTAAGPVVPLGPATMMADKLLIPVTGGIGVFDPGTGVQERIIAVNRPQSASGNPVIVPAIAGSTVLEQRGRTLVALGT